MPRYGIVLIGLLRRCFPQLPQMGEAFRSDSMLVMALLPGSSARLVLALGHALACAPAGAAAVDAATANGTASATILRPVSVTNLSDLDFGLVEARPDAEGIVVVGPAQHGAHFSGSAKPACVIGKDCPVAGPARFLVNGEPARNYRVFTPAIVYLEADQNRFAVNGFIVRTQSRPATPSAGQLDPWAMTSSASARRCASRRARRRSA